MGRVSERHKGKTAFSPMKILPRIEKAFMAKLKYPRVSRVRLNYIDPVMYRWVP